MLKEVVPRLHTLTCSCFDKQVSTFLLGLTMALMGLVLASCDKRLTRGEDLSRQDIEFISSLGVLDKGENVILFDSQGGGFKALETSGNFFTDKRIAAYWIDTKDSTKTTIDHAFYGDIDTIRRYPKYKSLTLASCLEVHRRDGTKFKVYVSADSARTWTFFHQALEQWSRKNAR